jgi:peptidoglycan/xylan/chitin deacetylase (PgdA/CDA1 family)
MKSALLHFVYRSGIVYGIRSLNNWGFDRPIKILYCHRVVGHDEYMRPLLLALDNFDVDEFERFIRYLVKFYNVITLEKAIEYLKSPKPPKRPNQVVLTFDDGYASFYTHVFPILIKYKVPASLFLTTDAINNKVLLWYDRLVVLFEETRMKSLEMSALSSKYFKFVTTSEKARVITEIGEMMKKEKPESLNEILDEVQIRLGVTQENMQRYKPMLSWEQIRELKRSPYISLGSHTCSHPILTKMTGESFLREIELSKEILEKELQMPITGFSYPNGDHSLRVRQSVEKAGYEYGLTTYRQDINNFQDARTHDMFALRRIPFSHESFNRFTLRMSGLFDLMELAKGVTRRANIWLPHYLSRKLSLKGSSHSKPIHILVSICDHFEPLWNNASDEIGEIRVKNFLHGYRKIASKYKDGSGRLPKYSFFYPIEEYRENYMNLLAEFCNEGYGEVEVHLHHDKESSSHLQRRLVEYKRTLRERHGLLSVNKDSGEVMYGFIHGNWALDNSRKDGRKCGINNELDVLRQTGCYADFTMPSVPDETQTSTVNSIYYAIDDPEKPKSHDRGFEILAGSKGQTNKWLMMIQGPLELNWHRRKMLFTPTIENGELCKDNPINPHRVRLWIKANIHARKRTDCIFVKLYTHGCQEGNMKSLLDYDFHFLFSHMERNYNDGKEFSLHYITAREMFNIVKWIEDHDPYEELNMKEARDYKLVR